MEKIERFKRGIAAMSADEREALHNALAAAVALENPVERSDLVDYITDIGAGQRAHPGPPGQRWPHRLPAA